MGDTLLIKAILSKNKILIKAGEDRSKLLPKKVFTKPGEVKPHETTVWVSPEEVLQGDEKKKTPAQEASVNEQVKKFIETLNSLGITDKDKIKEWYDVSKSGMGSYGYGLIETAHGLIETGLNPPQIKELLNSGLSIYGIKTNVKKYSFDKIKTALDNGVPPKNLDKFLDGKIPLWRAIGFDKKSIAQDWKGAGFNDLRQAYVWSTNVSNPTVAKSFLDKGFSAKEASVLVRNRFDEDQSMKLKEQGWNINDKATDIKGWFDTGLEYKTGQYLSKYPLNWRPSDWEHFGGEKKYPGLKDYLSEKNIKKWERFGLDKKISTDWIIHGFIDPVFVSSRKGTTPEKYSELFDKKLRESYEKNGVRRENMYIPPPSTIASTIYTLGKTNLSGDDLLKKYVSDQVKSQREHDIYYTPGSKYVGD